MKKLKLIMADMDTCYVHNLVRYMLLKYSQSFEIFTFTCPEALNMHLEAAGEEADIMLLGREFITVGAAFKKHGITVLLSEDDVCLGNNEMMKVYKYQHADKLVTELIAIYSGIGGKCHMPGDSGNTLIIAAASAVGGCGKSAIAACGSAMCARQGARVLYLNLEAVSSTASYFTGSSERTFTNVIYYLKENSTNLALKIEGVRCLDPDTGVYFFKPAESLQDMDELLFEDTELLFDTLRRSAGYDVIFVDLSSGLNARNIAALKSCDYVLSVSPDRKDAAARNDLLQAEYPLLLEKYGADVDKKSIQVISMCKYAGYYKDNNTIGFYPELDQGFVSSYTGCQGFCSDIGRLLGSLSGESGSLAALLPVINDNGMGGSSRAI